MTIQRLRPERLAAEEQKLLQAHYADAISLLRYSTRNSLESARSGRELRASRKASASSSRPWNGRSTTPRRQSPDAKRSTGRGVHGSDENCASDSRIYITAEGFRGADLVSPFAQLLDPSVEDQIAPDRETIRTAYRAVLLGSKKSPAKMA